MMKAGSRSLQELSGAYALIFPLMFAGTAVGNSNYAEGGMGEYM